MRALYVYNANPAAVCPDQTRVLQGLRREDLFTVVHEQFPTDTADYADIVLPATTQLEHFDIHGSYGHLYVQINEPAIAPLGEAKSNTDVFRLLARRLGFEPELFEVTDEELAALALAPDPWERPFPPHQAFDGITLERLKEEGPMRLNLPRTLLPSPTAVSAPSRANASSTAPPWPPGAWTRCRPTFRRTRTRKRGRTWRRGIPCSSSARNPRRCLNSTFANVESLRRQAGEPTLEIHPEDAARRGLHDGQMVRVFNDRGSFQARAKSAPRSSPGSW